MTTQEEKQDELLSSNEEEEEEEEEEEVVEAPKKRGRKPKQKNQKKQKLDESALKTFDLVLFKAALSGVGLASNGALLDGPADAALKDAVTSHAHYLKIKNQNWSNVITNKIVKIMEFMDLVNSLEYIFSFPLLENEGKDDLVSKAIVDIDSAIKTFATIGSHSECSDTIEFYRGQTELLTLSFIVKQMSLDQVKAIRFVAKMFGPKISHAKDPRLAANLSNRQSLITQKFALVEAGNLSNILDGFKFELLVAPIVAAVRRTLVMLLSLDNFDPKSNCPQVFFGPPCEVVEDTIAEQAEGAKEGVIEKVDDASENPYGRPPEAAGEEAQYYDQSMHHLAQTYYHGQYSPEDSFNSYIYPGYLQAGGTNGEAGYEFEESPIPPKNKRAPKISAAWAERHAQGDYGQNEELSDIEPDEVVYGVDYGEMRFLAPIKGTAGRGHGSWDDDKFVCLKRLFESITPNGARLKNSIVINLEIVGN